MRTSRLNLQNISGARQNQNDPETSDLRRYYTSYLYGLRSSSAPPSSAFSCLSSGHVQTSPHLQLCLSSGSHLHLYSFHLFMLLYEYLFFFYMFQLKLENICNIYHIYLFGLFMSDGHVQAGASPAARLHHRRQI